MDEPCSALDPIATRIEELIDELRQNYTIIIVTHSMQQAARVSQRPRFFHLGHPGRDRAETDLHQPERQDAPRTTSPAGSASARRSDNGDRRPRRPICMALRTYRQSFDDN